jgi:hypothetical protein
MSPHASTIEPTAPRSAHHLARRHIGEAQFRAGKEFRRLFAVANMGTAHNSAAAEALAKSYRDLGADGSALVRAMLTDNLSAKEIAAARGMKGQQWPLYFARRFFEALNTLAETFGFLRKPASSMPACGESSPAKTRA